MIDVSVVHNSSLIPFTSCQVVYISPIPLHSFKYIILKNFFHPPLPVMAAIGSLPLLAIRVLMTGNMI